MPIVTYSLRDLFISPSDQVNPNPNRQSPRYGERTSAAVADTSRELGGMAAIRLPGAAASTAHRARRAAVTPR